MLKILKILWWGSAFALGIFGFSLAIGGNVNPKYLPEIGEIDAQLSAWIYGAIFAFSANSIFNK